MARFDVYRNPGQQAAQVPFVLDVQADLLSDLATRVVIPLRRREAMPPGALPRELLPTVQVQGIACVLQTNLLAAVPARLLRDPVANLRPLQLEIGSALDFLFQGF